MIKLGQHGNRLFTEEEIEKAMLFFTPFDGIEWVKHPDYGWIATGDGAYSFRVAGDPHFPFRIFNHIIEYIGQNSK
jgi:hypothetical protein